MQMLRSNLLAIFALLLLTVGVGSLFETGSSWIAFAIIGISAILICMEMMVRNMPSSIRTTIEKNCMRYDGTVSMRRKNIELRVVRRLKRDTALILAMVVLPSTFLLWIVNKEVIPLSIGFNTIFSISPLSENRKSGFADGERQFRRWNRNQVGARSDTESHKRWLRKFWPFVMASGVAWIGLCCLIVRKTYLRMLGDLLSNARFRSQQYHFGDLGIEDEQQFQRQRSRKTKEPEISR